MTTTEKTKPDQTESKTPPVVEAQYAEIQMQEKFPDIVSADPEEIRGKKGGISAPTNLTPIVTFEASGQYVIGEFLGIRHGVGPNKSRLYDIRLDEARLKRMNLDRVEGGLIVSVWGTTILDTMMDMIPKMPGDIIYIQYVEDRETARKQNPAHVFKVMVFPK